MTAKYIYHLDFTIKSSLTPMFERSFAKVMDAHLKHEKGLGHQMNFYRTFSGGKDVITLVIGMDSLGQMDRWMHTPEIVLEYYGKEEGFKILQDYCDSMQAWESYIKCPYNPFEEVLV